MAAKGLNGSKFVTDNSDYIRRAFYNLPRCFRQNKWNQNPLETKRNSFSFFLFCTRGGRASGLRACLDAMLLPRSYKYIPKPFGGRWQHRWTSGDKECHCSRVTNSGRAWRKVSESDARSAGLMLIPYSVGECSKVGWPVFSPYFWSWSSLAARLPANAWCLQSVFLISIQSRRKVGIQCMMSPVRISHLDPVSLQGCW